MPLEKSEIKCEIKEVVLKFPKKLLKIADFICNLIGTSKEEFFADVIVREFGYMFEEPDRIFTNLNSNRESNKFFTEFRDALNQYFNLEKFTLDQIQI